MSLNTPDKQQTLSASMNPYSRAMLRKLLDAVLPIDSDFESFCIDSFPDVTCRFSNGMDRTQKVNLLIIRHPVDVVLAALRKSEPQRTALYQQRLFPEIAKWSSSLEDEKSLKLEQRPNPRWSKKLKYGIIGVLICDYLKKLFTPCRASPIIGISLFTITVIIGGTGSYKLLSRTKQQDARFRLSVTQPTDAKNELRSDTLIPTVRQSTTSTIAPDEPVKESPDQPAIVTQRQASEKIGPLARATIRSIDFHGGPGCVDTNKTIITRITIFDGYSFSGCELSTGRCVQLENPIGTKNQPIELPFVIFHQFSGDSIRQELSKPQRESTGKRVVREKYQIIFNNCRYQLSLNRGSTQ